MNFKRTVSIVMAVIMAALMLTGCKGAKPTGLTPEATQQPQQAADAANTPIPDARVSCVNRAGEATPITVYLTSNSAVHSFEYSTRFTDCTNSFAVRMTEAVAKDKNWTGVYSPLSLQIVLQLLANGGDEQTSEALFNAVCEGMTRSDVNDSTAKLLYMFKTIRGLSMNSAVIVNKDLSVKQSFAELAGTYYDAAIGTLDMSDAAAAEAMINSWISERTGKHINNLADGIIDRDTVMVLLNTLSLDFEWDAPFTVFRELTEFAGSKGTEMVSMLHRSDEFLYKNFEEGRMAVIPYKNNNYAMAVILPEGGRTPEQAVSALMSRWGECVSTPGSVNMPKVQLDSDIDVMSIIQELGIAEAIGGSFTELLANDGEATVSNIVHGAVIDVNEYGTTAAAATAATLNKAAPAVEQFNLTCDRPYAMVIYNTQTGTVLFVSIVNDIG